MRYINFDNLINESLSLKIILTKVNFDMKSVAYLMLNLACFVLGKPLGTFILAHVLVKSHFKAFVALSRSSTIFLSKTDTPVCQTEQPSFYRLALTLLFLDSQLYCGLFIYN
jgi:hypothetical protein